MRILSIRLSVRPPHSRLENKKA